MYPEMDTFISVYEFYKARVLIYRYPLAYNNKFLLGLQALFPILALVTNPEQYRVNAFDWDLTIIRAINMKC